MQPIKEEKAVFASMYTPILPHKDGFWEKVVKQLKTPMKLNSQNKSKLKSYCMSKDTQDLVPLFYRYVGFIPEEKEVLEEEKPLFTETGSAEADVVIDTTFLGGSLARLNNIANPVLSLLGGSMALMSLAGIGSYAKGEDLYEEASLSASSQDVMGQWEGVILKGIGVSEVISGLALVLNAPLFLVTSICKNEAISSGGRTAMLVSSVGASIFGGFIYFLSSIWSGLGLRETLSLSNRLGFGFFKSASSDQIVANLKKELSFSPTEVWETLKIKYPTKTEKELQALLENEVDLSSKSFLRKISSFWGQPIEESKLGVISDGFLKNKLSEHKMLEGLGFFGLEENHYPKNFTTKQKFGLHIAIEQLKKTKTKELERCLGSKAWELVQKELLGTDMDKVKKTLGDALWEQGLFDMGMGVIGVLGTFVSVVIATGYFIACSSLILVCTVFSVFVFCISVLVDGKDLLNSWSKIEEVSLLDKIASYGNLMVGFGCLVGILAISIASMGTVPLVVVMTGGALWLAVSLANVYMLRRKEKLYTEMHCTREELEKKILALQTRVSIQKESKEIKEIVKRTFQALGQSLLPLEKKQSILEKFTKIEKEEFSALQAVLQDWKEMEECMKEEMHKALQEITPQGSTKEKSSFVDQMQDWIRGFSSVSTIS